MRREAALPDASPDAAPTAGAVRPSLVIRPPRDRRPAGPPVYAALDLGTNNCRLLVAEPGPGGLRVTDSFSRIVRLGEGLAATGRLSEAAIARTLDALRACRDKIRARGATRLRLVATEACRAAANGAEFVALAKERTGIALEVIDRETEARLAVAGASSLVDPAAAGAVLFDIGGGSTEIVWLERARVPAPAGPAARPGWLEVRGWTSLPVGVVTLAERRGGDAPTPENFAAMVDEVGAMIDGFPGRAAAAARCGGYHLLGASGTVTTVASVALGLPRYDRRKVDGHWMTPAEVDAAVAGLMVTSLAARSDDARIGAGRADLVLPGCAILLAIMRAFPCARLRVADRGLREGMLTTMMRDDGTWRGEARA